MRWPFGRKSPPDHPATDVAVQRGAVSESGPALSASVPSPVTARPTGEWRRVPVIQRSVGDAPLTAPTAPFQADLELLQPAPTALAPLGHEISAMATPGMVDGFVTAAPPQTIGSHGPELTLRPSVQRQAHDADAMDVFPTWPAAAEAPIDAHTADAPADGGDANTAPEGLAPMVQRLADPAGDSGRTAGSDNLPAQPSHPADDARITPPDLSRPIAVAPITAVSRMSVGPVTAPSAAAAGAESSGPLPDLALAPSPTSEATRAAEVGSAAEPPAAAIEGPAAGAGPVTVQRLVPDGLLTRVPGTPAGAEPRAGVLAIAPIDGPSSRPTVEPVANASPAWEMHPQTAAPSSGHGRSAPVQRLTLGQARRLGLGAPLDATSRGIARDPSSSGIAAAPVVALEPAPASEPGPPPALAMTAPSPSAAPSAPVGIQRLALPLPPAVDAMPPGGSSWAPSDDAGMAVDATRVADPGPAPAPSHLDLAPVSRSQESPDAVGRNDVVSSHETEAGSTATAAPPEPAPLPATPIAVSRLVDRQDAPQPVAAMQASPTHVQDGIALGLAPSSRVGGPLPGLQRDVAGPAAVAAQGTPIHEAASTRRAVSLQRALQGIPDLEGNRAVAGAIRPDVAVPVAARRNPLGAPLLTVSREAAPGQGPVAATPLARPAAPLELPRLELQRSLDRGGDNRSAQTWEAAPSPDVSSIATPGSSASAGPSLSVQLESDAAAAAGSLWPDTDGADAVVQRAAASGAGGGHPREQDLDDLADRLYGRLRIQLGRELLLDRERAGLIGDAR